MAPPLKRTDSTTAVVDFKPSTARSELAAAWNAIKEPFRRKRTDSLLKKVKKAQQSLQHSSSLTYTSTSPRHHRATTCKTACPAIGAPDERSGLTAIRAMLSLASADAHHDVAIHQAGKQLREKTSTSTPPPPEPPPPPPTDDAFRRATMNTSVRQRRVQHRQLFTAKLSLRLRDPNLLDFLPTSHPSRRRSHGSAFRWSTTFDSVQQRDKPG